MAKLETSVVVASLCLVVAASGCSTDSAPAVGADTTTIKAALLATIENDFEDGTAQGWIPRGPPRVPASVSGSTAVDDGPNYAVVSTCT